MQKKTDSNLFKIALFEMRTESDLQSFKINFDLIKEWLKKHSKEKLADFEDFPKKFIGTGFTLEQVANKSFKIQKEILEKEAFFYNSLFLTLYSLLENNLNSSCILAKYIAKSKLDIHDLKDRGIKRSSRYLNVLLEIDLSKFKEWEKVLLYNGMRNYISHNRLEVKGEEKQIIKYLEKHKMMIDFDDETKYVKFTEEMIGEAVETVEKLLNWVYEQIINKYSIIKKVKNG
ncbi:MAG: hypothetical protein JXA66_03330, partial [Oligoflexia bacterium]|nr:hypothetical protein [Oligoflexia bacterium]